MGADLKIRNYAPPPEGEEREAKIAELVTQALAEVEIHPRPVEMSGDILTWEDIEKKAWTIAQDIVIRGHFRDAYNPTSLLNVLGRSWWQDVLPHVNRQKILPRQHVEELLDWVAATPVPPARAIFRQLQEIWSEVTDVNPKQGPWWRAYFLVKRKLFVHFLQEALKPGHSVEALL